MKPSRKNYLVPIALLLLAAAFLVVMKQKSPNAESSGGGAADIASSDAVASDGASPETTRPQRNAPREADRLLAAEGAKTDVTLSSFPSKEYQHLPSPAGKAQSVSSGEAYIHVPSTRRRIAMDANQIGEYPAIETKLNDIVGVRLTLDEVKPGTPVRVVIMDGGTFPTVQGAAQLLKATSWGGVAFEYSTSGNIGFHRVLVQAKGRPARILNFNAGDGESWPIRSTASTN